MEAHFDFALLNGIIFSISYISHRVLLLKENLDLCQEAFKPVEQIR